MRLGIISDIHANLIAFEACLAVLDREDLDEIVCLGDVVGYGPEPQRCVDLVRDRGYATILGNHDIAVATGEGLGCFNVVAHDAVIWTRENLDADAIDWLKARPRQLERPEVVLAHGAPGDTDHYVLSPGDATEILEASDAWAVVCGHTHLPLVHAVVGGEVDRQIRFPETITVELPEKGRVFLNPGSVGQPRDGVADAAFAILDTEVRSFKIFRESYDVQQVLEAVQAAGLPEVLGVRLLVGQ